MLRFVVQMRIGNLTQVKTQTGPPAFWHDRYNCLPMLHRVSKLIHKNVDAALVKPA